MSPLGAIPGQPEEEAVVDSSAPGSFSAISLSSASPADSDLNGPVVPPPPMNTPAKSIVSGGSQSASPGNPASFEQLLSCFYPFNRFWPFNWNGAQKEIYPGSDSETDNYEISLESIQVNFKEDYCGGGTSSSVFRGKWKGQWIALKKLNRASEVDIKRLCNLDHPNVIKTLGVCTKDIYPCIVMEYCQNGGLFDYLRRTPILHKSLFLRWSIEVASGMAYLHSLKVVHRDLKSPNILVDNRDTLKICDFGSLYTWDQKLNSQSQPTIPTQMDSVVMSVCGTSQWMSPEMMKNEPCNEKVDVWSYGVVLWELLTGEIPFERIAPMAVCFGVGSDRLRLAVPRTAPESVKFLLKLCWAKKPRNRPSFMSILNNLNNLQAELGEMQEDGWTMRRELWRREIAEENAKLMLHNSGAGEMNAQKQKEEELIQKRMHELRHAQEIRQLYENKLRKVDRIMRRITRLNQQMETQKKLNEQICEELNNRMAHNGHWHQLLLEWNAALREMTEKRRGTGIGTTIAELNYLVKQAEEAKKTAMFLHGEEGGNELRQKGTRESMKTKEETQKIVSGRPAILKMTYFDYDENGRRIGIEQRVIDQQMARNVLGSTFGERKSICYSAAKCVRPSRNEHFYARRHNNSSSPSSSSDDDAGNGRQTHHPKYSPTIFKEGNQQNHEQKRKKKRLQSAKIQEMGVKHPIQHQNSLLSSCPSECSSLANAPSNYSGAGGPISSRNSSYRHSADPQSPMSFQTTPKSVLSRDDSAISSTLPFSPSDRSLQNLANNNPQFTAPHHPLPQFCINCHSNLAFPLNNNIFQQQFFARNSVARASGLSADSGVCPEENLPMGESLPSFHPFLSDVLEEKNGNLLAAPHGGQFACCLAPNSCQCPLKNFVFKNREGWSGEKIKSKKHRMPRQPASQIPFARESPLRTTMAARKTDSLKKGRGKTNDEQRQAKCPASTLPHDNVEVVYRSQQPYNANYHSHCSSTSSSATLGHSPHIKQIPRNRRLTELREQQSPTNQEYQIHWLSSPELCHFLENDSSECSRRESPKEEEGMSKKDEDQKLNLGTIEEMTDSQLTERAIAAEKAMAAVMLESSSTMVSSLERSLEMAVTHSDGLSDREMKLREAKTTFKLTHRRTASNPTNYPCIQQQKSTDGSTSSAGIDQKHQTTHQEEDCDDESSSAESEENEGSQGGATNEDFQQICTKIAL